jgi:hypothetical protein
MDITYTWKIQKLSVMQSPENNFVTGARWTCSGTDGTHVVSMDGETAFTPQQDSPVVPYADLTEDIVYGWIQSAMGEIQLANTIISIKAAIEGQINSLALPPEIATIESPPWE